MKKIWLAVLMGAWLVAPAAGAAQMVFSPERVPFDYFAVPYPNDLHRRPDGTVDRRGYPVPIGNPLSVHYRNLADGADGFAVSESAFIRFNGDINPARLPGVEDTVKPGSPVFIVNVDPKSPAHGERIPAWLWFHTQALSPLYRLLAVCPYPGFVLRENTTYAVVVLTSLDPGLKSSPVLLDLLSGRAPKKMKDGARAVEVYRPLAVFLREQSIAPDSVAAATVYTTGDPTRGLRAIMAYVDSLPPATLDEPLKPWRDHDSFYALRSSYSSPQFQTGTGSQLVHNGQVKFDSNGKPIVQRMERIPIVVTVPKGKMPPSGWPLVIYLHGGGNKTNEFTDHIIKSPTDAFTPGQGPARVFAERGIGGVTGATVKNPERLNNEFGDGGRFAELPFYNFFRGDVMVGNHWQASADNAVLLRLMRQLTIDPALCPATDAGAAPSGAIRYDARYFFAMGFSMGGTILGSWSGVEPGIIASIPAGASGHWGMLIRNFTGVPQKPYFFAWITGGRPKDPMDARWPTISIIQAVLEPCDTITYGPHVFRRPFPGNEPKNVYLAVGRNDFYTKTITQNAVITSLGLPLAGPVIDEEIMVSQRIQGFDQPQQLPVSQNAATEDGRRVTAAALQYEPDTWTGEGHNVDYNLTETKHQYGCFLRSLIDLGVATIPEPGPEASDCGVGK